MTHPTIVSLGGGVNSTAMVVAMILMNEPIDAIVFSDTGGEKPETYESVRRLSEWTQSKGYPAVTTVSRNESLEDYCTDRKMLPSLAYGFKQCAGDFKIKPIHNWVKNWDPAIKCWAEKGKVTKCIGFDFGTRDRARAEKFGEDYPKKYQLRYPLIEMQLTREMCRNVIENVGLEVPIKSCCFFCPAHKKHEVIELSKTHPELFERALAIEDLAMPGLTTSKGLGRNFSWRTVVKNGLEQMTMFDDSPDISCVCGQ